MAARALSSEPFVLTAAASCAPLFPGSDKATIAELEFDLEVRTVSFVPASPLATLIAKIKDVFRESDDIILAFDYGRSGEKRIYIRQDDELQAACVSWPGSPRLRFTVELLAFVDVNFDSLCLRRLSLLGEPRRLARLDKRITDTFEAPGSSFIMTMRGVGDVMHEFSMFHALALIMKMRQMTHPIILAVGGNIIKFEGEKTFVVFPEPAQAVLAGVLIQAALQDFNSGSDDPAMQIQVSIGVDTGRLLLIPHDFYGDCVNVSSKLGEDTAEAGQFLVTKETHDLVRADRRFHPVVFVPGTAMRSGVQLHYFEVTGRVSAATADAALANLGAAANNASSAGSSGGGGGGSAAHHRESTFAKLCRQRLLQDRAGNTSFVDERIRERYEQTKVILVSDMSGFTRTVKKHGILHFLSIIMKMRSICVPILREHGGQLIKFEADNLYFVFDDPDLAVRGVLLAQASLQAWNATMEVDSRAIMHLGMDYGSVLNATDDEDIYGYHRNRAEKLGEGEADDEEVLLTESMAALLKRRYEFGAVRETDGDNGETIRFVQVMRVL